MRKDEILSLRWSNVHGDVIKLAGEDAKGDGSEDYARYIPMVGKDLAGILARRTAARQVKRKGTVTLAEFVFHHNGKRITDFSKVWRSAIRKAGLRHIKFPFPYAIRQSTSWTMPVSPAMQQWRSRVTKPTACTLDIITRMRSERGLHSKRRRSLPKCWPRKSNLQTWCPCSGKPVRP